MLRGRFTPEEFGRLTLWQMVNLFGFSGIEEPRQLSERDRHWMAGRARGRSELEIYERWQQRKADSERG